MLLRSVLGQLGQVGLALRVQVGVYQLVQVEVCLPVLVVVCLPVRAEDYRRVPEVDFQRAQAAGCPQAQAAGCQQVRAVACQLVRVVVCRQALEGDVQPARVQMATVGTVQIPTADNERCSYLLRLQRIASAGVPVERLYTIEGNQTAPEKGF